MHRDWQDYTLDPVTNIELVPVRLLNQYRHEPDIPMPRLLITGAVILAALFAVRILVGANGTDPARAGEIVIDANGPKSPWGKTTGDIDGDGRLDILVGGHDRSDLGLATRILRKVGLVDTSRLAGDLVWYRNPSWEKHLISTDFRIRTDLAVTDIDADGANDIVVLADKGVFWLKNPEWHAHEIAIATGTRKFHDVEAADLDRDGDIDLVLRNQSLFGYNDGDQVILLVQETPMAWRTRTLGISHGEGLALGDLDGDGYTDIIVNNVWLENPRRNIAVADWRTFEYAPDWNWSDVYIDVDDVNSDGKPDVLVSPSEPEGKTYRISWFEATQGPDAQWTEHVVDEPVEAVHHFIGAGDFNGDGHTDIFAAEMNQGNDPDEVKVYLNGGDNETWSKQVLSSSGSHSMEVADFDGDKRDEVVGANWEIAGHEGGYPVSIWTQATTTDTNWRRHEVGSNGPWHNLFVTVADMDGDGHTDIISGRSWFRNPGVLSGRWTRHHIANGLGTAYLVHDFDHDGDIDVFGSPWDGLLEKPGLMLRARAKVSGSGYPGSGDGGDFRWAENDGAGAFALHENVVSAEGDYPQGVTLHKDANGEGLVISWHKPGSGIHRIGIPAMPLSQQWGVERVSDFSQDEQLSSVDIDGDGVEEVFTGTSWLAPVSGWDRTSFHTGSEPPDRHVVVDIDANGSIDVVVGFEAISKPGKLALYRDVADAGVNKVDEQVIDFPIGPMSLSAIDMDGDADIDLIVGEHDLQNPVSARLLLYENVDGAGFDWKRSVIAVGDEHHNGALVVDLDRDGDYDVVSIGWGHSRVMVFENLAAM